MNIYSKEGDKIIVTEESKDCGYSHDQEKIVNYLQVGNVYTVEYTDVSRWHTDVYLKEFPGIPFNSVNFEDFDPTIKEEKEGKENNDKGGKIVRRFDILRNGLDFLDGDLDGIIGTLKSLERTYKKEGYNNLSFRRVDHWDWVEYVLSGDRLETDEDYKNRMIEEKKEEIIKELIKTKEYEEYIKLKSKFEK